MLWNIFGILHDMEYIRNSTWNHMWLYFHNHMLAYVGISQYVIVICHMTCCFCNMLLYPDMLIWYVYDINILWCDNIMCCHIPYDMLFLWYVGIYMQYVTIICYMTCCVNMICIWYKHLVIWLHHNISSNNITI